MFLMVGLFWGLFAAPGIALIAGVLNHSLLLIMLGGASIGAHVLVSLFSFRKERKESLHLLFFPVGLLMFSFMFLWSGYRCIKNGGIDWRGTHYTLDELRAAQRVKF